VHGDHLFLKHEAFNLNNTENADKKYVITKIMSMREIGKYSGIKKKGSQRRRRRTMI